MDTKLFKELIKIAKKERIKIVELEGVKIEFWLDEVKAAGPKLKIAKIDDELETPLIDKKKEDEDLLFHSAN